MVVHAANIQDRDGAKLVLSKMVGRFPRLKVIWADGAYAGKLVAWAWVTGGWLLSVIRRRPDSHSFEALPRRWGGGADVGVAGPLPALEQRL